MAYTVNDIQIKAESLLGTELSEKQKSALTTVCAAAAAELENRMREGASPEAIGETYVTAAGMLALAMYIQLDCGGDFTSSFTAGNVHLSRSAGNARASAATLRKQAENLLAAYLEDGGFCFLGVRG